MPEWLYLVSLLLSDGFRMLQNFVGIHDRLRHDAPPPDARTIARTPIVTGVNDRNGSLSYNS
jgi:hypothetical protein